MITVEYFVVTENTDKNAGEGTDVDTSIAFVKKADAVEFVNSESYRRFAIQGVYHPGSNSDYNVRKRVCNVYKDIKEYQKLGVNQEKLENVQKIIDKLTDVEYNLLQEHVHKNRPTNNKR